MPTADRPLRVVALAASAQLGGTERVLLDLADRAFEHDVALSVLTPRDGPLVGILNEIGVPAAVVPAPDSMLRGSQQPGRLWSAPAALFGIRRWAHALARHTAWQQADLLYSISFKPHLASAMHHDRPLIWHLHEFPPSTTGWAWRLLAQRVPDGLIANSEAVGKAWRAGGQAGSPATQEGPLVVCPNGVDLDRFRPRPRTFWIHDQLGLAHSQRLIGMPAVFARWKGQLEVLEAFQAIHEDLPDVHLVVIGGAIYDTVAERSYGTMLEPRVRAAGAHLLPFQPDIERVYPELDLAVHYSLRPEPFGRVILEAMACGIPVVAAAEGGPLEILGGQAPGRQAAGWLVEPRQPKALAAALDSLLTLPRNDLAAIGVKARQEAEDRFSARAFARSVIEVLRQVARPGA